MKVVGGPRQIRNPRPRLYLYRVGSFYLSCEKFELADHFRNNGAKYFRTGSKRMYRTLPSWFRSEGEARDAAKAMGFRVVKIRPMTANAKPKAPKRRAGGKP